MRQTLELKSIILRLRPLLNILAVGIVLLFPLKVPFITVILAAFLSILLVKYQKGKLIHIGFKKTKILELFTTSIIVAFIIFLLAFVLLKPIIESATQVVIDYSVLKAYAKDISLLIVMILISWTSAAVCEEIIFRGFLIPTINDLFASKKYRNLVSLVLSSVLFGLVHFYQGISGIILTGVIGFFIGVIFIKKNYNIWYAILIHGFIDTIFMLAYYFNLISI